MNPVVMWAYALGVFFYSGWLTDADRLRLQLIQNGQLELTLFLGHEIVVNSITSIGISTHSHVLQRWIYSVNQTQSILRDWQQCQVIHGDDSFITGTVLHSRWKSWGALHFLITDLLIGKRKIIRVWEFGPENMVSVQVMVNGTMLVGSVITTHCNLV